MLCSSSRGVLLAACIASFFSGTIASEAIPRAAPAASLTSVVPLEPLFFSEYGSQRVQVRYGPYTVPPSSENNGMKEWIVPNAPKPCTDCLITWLRADLEYPDGRPANTDTGLWLHHTVSSCRNKVALTCGEDGRGDRFFSNGNERSAFDIAGNGTQLVGYYLSKNDKLATLLELMNLHSAPQDAVLTMTYEFVPGVPEGFSKAKPLWMDIAGCAKDHELPLEITTGTIEYNSDAWLSDKNYRIVANIGHLHDGGIDHYTMRNGKVICDSRAMYGETAAYQSSPEAFSLMANMTHLSSMGKCVNQGYLIPGDELTVKSYYNLTERTPMIDADGGVEPIMGISWLWIVEDDNLPLADKLRAKAQTVAQNAKDHSYSWFGSLTFIVALVGIGFWLRRRTSLADAKTNSEASYPLETVDDTYRD